MTAPGAEPFPPKRSPDGRVEVRYAADEVRMTQWVRAPVVVRTRDDRVVASVSAWDAVATEFPGPGLAALGLRRYPDGANVVRVVVDVERETFGIGEGAAPDRPVAELAGALEAAFEATVRRDAEGYLGQEFCPYCKSKLYVGWLDRLLRRKTVTCLVCKREWPLRG